MAKKGSKGIRQRKTWALWKFFKKMQSPKNIYRLILVTGRIIKEEETGRDRIQKRDRQVYATSVKKTVN